MDKRDPITFLIPARWRMATCLRVELDGSITPLNAQGRRLIKVLTLNHPRQIEERLNRRRLLDNLAIHDRALYERLMGFPADLPDLANLAPPQNHRPEGIAESHFARRQRGELPAIY